MILAKKQILSLIVVITVLLSSLNVVFGDSEKIANQHVSQKQLAAIQSIKIDDDENKSDLVILLSSPATYTSYKTTTPLRLVIDLSQTAPEKTSDTIDLNKGNFKRVKVNRYDTDAGVLTRLDIEMNVDAEAVLSVSKDNPREIRVSFPLISPDKKILLSNDKKSVSKNRKNSEIVSSSKSESVEGPNAITSFQEGCVSGISVKDDGILIKINGGFVGDYQTMRLGKPERFVVDLNKVTSMLDSRIIPINYYGVSSARVGIYPDKLRIVFDAVKDLFPESSIKRVKDGLLLSVKPIEKVINKELLQNSDSNRVKDVVEKDLKRIDVRADKTNDNVKQFNVEVKSDIRSINDSAQKMILGKHKDVIGNKVSNVEMIDFQEIDNITRISIKTSEFVVIEGPRNSPGFVTLTIKNTILPKRLLRSIESKGFNSPVLRVTPFIARFNKNIDAKIRIAIRKKSSYDFRQEGDMIYIDFKNLNDFSLKHNINVNVRESHSSIVRRNNNEQLEIGAVLAAQPDAIQKQSSYKKVYKGRKVTLEFADAEVRKIFQLLSEVSSRNFVLGDDVTGTISIKLVNVPWDQALDIILDAKGLDKREDGNIIIIKGKGKFKSQADEDRELKKVNEKSTELETAIFKINYATPEEIVTQFKSYKSQNDEASINIDKRTNKIIVRDIPQAIKSMRDLLKDLDVPEKQVMIEARIVEASSTFTRNLGVNWGVHYRDGSGSFLGITGLDTGFGGLTSAPPTSGAGTTSGGNVGISFGTLASNIQLDLRLSAAASAGLIKIVSTPKVATLNNKTAKITQGQQIPYTSSTSDKVETKFVEAALSLEVTPTINANGTISMKIDAKNDSMGSVPSGSTAPAINKKQATTEMLLKDGETTVIGGIFVDSDNDTDEGVPFLMDIPVLGKLFKTSNKTKTKSELLIFITPRILGSI